METEPKARSHHRKRRERAQRLQLEQSDTEVEQGADDNSPSRGPKERSRSKPRKKKNGPGTYEEDIIGGFAIVSFKSVDDLEKYTSGKLLCKKTAEKETNKGTCKERCGVEKANRRNHSLSPGRHKPCHAVKKKDKKQNVIGWSHKKHNSSGVDNSGESSGETTDNLDTSELNKTINRPSFSDVSSSGDGYQCDSESGDARASDTSLDIFSSKPISQTINHTVKCEPVITPSSTAPPLPVVSCLNNSVTTATSSVTSTTSDVTVTTVTTTTSCVSLATTLTVTSVTVTTATPSVNSTITTNSLNHHHHQQQQQQQHHHHSQHQQHHSLPHQQQQQQHHQQHQHQQQVHPHHHYNHQSVDNKYSQHHNHHQKPRSDRDRERDREQRERCSKNSPVVKRHPPTPPPLTRSPRSPPRQRIPSTPSTPLPSSSLAASLPSSVSSSVISRESKRSPPLSRTPRREELRGSPYQVLPPSLAVSKPFLPPGFPSHGATPPSIYSPLGPSPGLHLHSNSTPSQPAFPAAGAIPGIAGSLAGVAGNPSLHPHHPAAAATPTPQSVPPNMFAPPLPLGPHSGHLPGSVGGAPPAHVQPESPVSLTNPDALREELNRRFLASQDRSSLLNSVPPFLRADIHQHMHQHQHQHQHTHQHTYHGGGLPPPPPPAMSASSLVPAPTPHPYDKMSNNPFFRQGLPTRPGIAEPAPRVVPSNKDKPTLPQHPRSSVPGLPGYPSMVLNPAGPGSSDALNSGIPGAFQPKGISGIPAVTGPVFMPVRDMDKSGAHLPATSSSSLPSGPKKVGKWCAVHVRIAWEIYNHQQQKQGDKGGEMKQHPEPLQRPPSHLLPPGGLPGASPLQQQQQQRPQELPTSAVPSVPLLGSSRSLFDSSPHSLVNPPSHVVPPSFQRPSPYSVASSLPLGIGNGSSSTSRDPALSISSAPHEWNRIHRTPPTFQAEREREIREISLERRREEDRDRERRMMDHDRHRFASLEDHGRDRYRDTDILNKSRSRSRSRSPMRNGRMDPGKSDRPFDRRLDDSANILKIKEERRDSLTREDEFTERDRLLKTNEYLTSNPLASADPLLMQATMLDRVRMLTPAAAFLGGDRVPPPHPSLWNPFDKGPMDFPNHRLNLQREMEQSRDHFLTRFPGVPGMQPGFAPGLAALEQQERLREELIMRDSTERAKRDYLERSLPLFHQRDRLYYENKIPSLRPQDAAYMAQMGHPFARNMSPALGHIKRSSPAVMPGVPPPLIHSVSTSQPRGHNSPAVNKTKGVSPTDSVGESKRDSNSNSTDPDVHSR